MLNLAGIFHGNLFGDAQTHEGLGEDLMPFIDADGFFPTGFRHDELFVVTEGEVAAFFETVHGDGDRGAGKAEAIRHVDRADFILAAFFLEHEDSFKIVLGRFKQFHDII